MLLGWLLDAPSAAGQALTLEEQKASAALDEVLALQTLPDTLLPRASAVLPQLMGLLRQSDASTAEIADRIGKDVALAAEVLRAAASVARGAGAVDDLQQAVQRIGIAGVQQAVSRVVFRPVYSSSAGTLGARAAPRLWQHAEALAERTAAQARDAGLPAFDGYIAGLLHGSGWTVALRVIDRAGIALALPLSEPAGVALDRRAHRLFGLAAKAWQITPGFQVLAEDARQVPLARSTLPLAACLRRAQAAFLLEQLGGAADQRTER